MYIINNCKMEMVRESVKVDTDIMMDLINNMIHTMTEEQRNENSDNLDAICRRLNDINYQVSKL